MQVKFKYFALVELLIIVIILIVLSAVVFPFLSGK